MSEKTPPEMDKAIISDGLTDAEIAEQAAVYGPLTESVRDLVDATIRSEIEPASINEIRGEIDALTKRLRDRQMPGSYGIRFGESSVPRNWGNAVVGLRNPIAPPLDVQRDDSGRVWADFTLGAAYEGPPGLVHGGVAALILDQMLGEGAAAAKVPGMTGTLTVRYRAGTPLGDLHAEAKIDRTEGIKTVVTGAIYTGAERKLCVEAEGLFILPRWARERMAAMGDASWLSGNPSGG